MVKVQEIFICASCQQMKIPNDEFFSLMAWRLYQETAFPRDRWICRSCQERMTIEIIPSKGMNCVRFA